MEKGMIVSPRKNMSKASTTEIKTAGLIREYPLIPLDLIARSSLFLFIRPKIVIVVSKILAGVNCTNMKGTFKRIYPRAPTREISEFKNLSILER
jgi:hypothetical protein